MCTVSWLMQDDGYALLFSRDEKRSRGIAQPPSVRSQGGVSFLAPTDPDAGGSWITTNELGVTVCLLNDYRVAQCSAASCESRGKLPVALAASESVDEVDKRLDRMRLERFAPFRLLALAPGEPPRTCSWDGRRLTVEPDAHSLMPLTSSSFQSVDVEQARRSRFPPGSLAFEQLERFHRSHAGPSPAHAVCMHRPDAQTVSLSRVVVRRESTVFFYQPGAPCEGHSVQTFSLQRASVCAAAS